METKIRLNTDTPGLAMIAVPDEVTVRDALLFAQERGAELAGRQVQIFCDGPPVAAALAWALKPWLRAGRWAVNGKLITLQEGG